MQDSHLSVMKEETELHEAYKYHIPPWLFVVCLLLVSVAGIVVGSGLATTGDAWYSLVGNVVVLKDTVMSVAPGAHGDEVTIDITEKGGSRLLLGKRPVMITLTDEKGYKHMYKIVYRQDLGIALQSMDTGQNILRLTRDGILIAGDGNPDPVQFEWARQKSNGLEQDVPLVMAGNPAVTYLNRLAIFNRVFLSDGVYVARGRHEDIPSLTGTVIGRGTKTFFMADVGPSLFNSVKGHYITTNSDAAIVNEGPVINTDTLTWDGFVGGLDDNTREPVLVLVSYSSGTTCVSTRSVADIDKIEYYKPGDAIDETSLMYSYLEKFHESIITEYLQQRQDDPISTINIETDPLHPCDIAAGDILIQVRNVEADTVLSMLSINILTNVCPDGYNMIACRSYNTFFSSF